MSVGADLVVVHVQQSEGLNGESRKARVYRTSIKGYENVRFIKVGKALCYIDEESLILEKATGESHPEAEWLVDVLKAAK